MTAHRPSDDATTNAYRGDRPEMARLLPTGPSRILDVGCSVGDFGSSVRRRNPDATLWGMDAGIAEDDFTSPHYDHYLRGSFPDDVPDGAPFDCIVFNDVLEHMEDPWAALRAARALLASGGTVVSSIPNIRYFRVVWSLAARGQWTYTDTGILDRTHLRFFTRAAIDDLFRSTGYDVDILEPATVPSTGKRALLWRVFPPGRDFLIQQYAVRAAPRQP